MPTTYGTCVSRQTLNELTIGYKICGQLQDMLSVYNMQYAVYSKLIDRCRRRQVYVPALIAYG